MKKILLAIIAATSILTVNAQEKVTTGFNFFDNWYGGLMVGATSSPQLHGMKPSIGFEFGKQISPNVGISLQGIGGINSTVGKNAFDEFGITLNGKLNFMNLFGGYNGTPRLFEVEGIAGIGMVHEFYPSFQRLNGNMLTARVGASLNFNLGKEKQWTVSLRPGYSPTLDGKGSSKLDIGSRFELMAGVVYHFKRNGRRHHGVMMAYDQDHVDRMNDKINDLRRRVSAVEDENKKVNDKNAELQAELNKRTNEVQKIKDTTFKMSMEPVVAFRQGKDLIDVSQLSNIESIANYMKENPELKLDIKGYASPEGNAKFNQKLSEKRAYTVKEILVNRYNIDADRITAKGMGVGDNFSKPEMNRAIVATFYK